MAVTFGYLNARGLSNDTVETYFTPKAEAEMRPLLCKNTDTQKQTSFALAASRQRRLRD